MRALLIASLCTLAGCPSVDLGEDPVGTGECRPDRDYFRDEIWPNYLAPSDPARSCVEARCHAANNGTSGMRFETDNTEAALDHNYEVVTHFLICGDPDASPLLTKPLADIDEHRGGDIFLDINDPAVDMFRAWFE